MTVDDEAARKARAQQLRDQIQTLKAPQRGENQEGASASPESPKEFIHRRMRELDQQESQP